MLKDYFSKVVILSLKGAKKRSEASLKAMYDRGLIETYADVTVTEAIRGDELLPSAWWRAGNGAWGCLCTHIRVLQDAWIEGVSNVLILEDDVCWVDNAKTVLDEVMPKIPKGWSQCYLGGQHRNVPIVLNDKWVQGTSINRTHAYAVTREAIPHILQHIQFAPDYIHAHEVRHIDHQYEVAHTRRDWKVVCPNYWLAGQEANQSQINGRTHLRMWWDWFDQRLDYSPIVVLDSEQDYKVHKHSIFLNDDMRTVTVLRDSAHPPSLRQAIHSTRRDAWIRRRLPAILKTSTVFNELPKDELITIPFAQLTNTESKTWTNPERFKYEKMDVDS